MRFLDTPQPHLVEGFLNTTKTYDAKSTSDTVSNHSVLFRGIQQKINEFSDRVSKNEPEDVTKFESREQMLKLVLDFYQNTDPIMYAKVQNVLRDPMITKDLLLVDNGKSTGKVTREGNRMTLEVRMTRDASGVVALARELANTAIYRDYFIEKQIEEQKKLQFVKEAANKFIESMVIDYLADRSMISPQMREHLQIEALQEMSRDIHSIECDQVIFQAMYEQNPEAFAHNLENYTPEDFYKSIEKWKDNPRSMEVVENRIKDIAEKGETQQYLMGKVLSELTALKLREQFYQTGDNQTVSKLLNGIENNKLLSDLTGMTNADLLAQGSNLVEHYNDLTRENMDENENVMVMERIKKMTDN